ncbi:MAG TPA: hypothetical protein VF552_06685 [Allosphingosinicella sp.]|jgi:hypothetical protein
MGRIALLAAAAALLVAAAPPATSGRAGWRITPDGLGPVRIGMSRAEVTRVVGAPLRGDEITEGCIEMQPARGWRGIYFMFEEGRLTRISMSGAESGIATPRGIRVGASEAEVRRAYGRGLESEEHTYQDAPALYLTYWTAPDRRGVRFETDAGRRVTTIHAGGASIRYVEGCL